ncbi:hypothetical protein B0H13DRAFT_1998642, partial [Mycena leptocephala]
MIYIPSTVVLAAMVLNAAAVVVVSSSDLAYVKFLCSKSLSENYNSAIPSASESVGEGASVSVSDGASPITTSVASSTTTFDDGQWHDDVHSTHSRHAHSDGDCGSWHHSKSASLDSASGSVPTNMESMPVVLPPSASAGNSDVMTADPSATPSSGSADPSAVSSSADPGSTSFAVDGDGGSIRRWLG